jgi:hypothetical protein
MISMLHTYSTKGNIGLGHAGTATNGFMQMFFGFIVILLPD